MRKWRCVVWSQLNVWQLAALKTLTATAEQIIISISLLLVYKLRRLRVEFGRPAFSSTAGQLTLTSSRRHWSTSHTGSWIISWSRLAVVDARSCVLFGHCVALICLWHWRHIKAEKGARRAFSDWRAGDWSGKRLTARTLGLFSATAQELAPKAWTSAETRKKNSKRQPT